MSSALWALYNFPVTIVVILCFLVLIFPYCSQLDWWAGWPFPCLVKHTLLAFEGWPFPCLVKHALLGFVSMNVIGWPFPCLVKHALLGFVSMNVIGWLFPCLVKHTLLGFVSMNVIGLYTVYCFSNYHSSTPALAWAVSQPIGAARTTKPR